MTRPANLGQAFEDAMTAGGWWDEFTANACCPNSSVAAARLCGCRGSCELPAGLSRLLTINHESEF